MGHLESFSECVQVLETVHSPVEITATRTINVGQSSQWPSLPPHGDNIFRSEATTGKIQTKS